MAWAPNNKVNPPPNPIENATPQSDVKKNYNRATAVRRDTDKHKNVTVTLLDIDTAIINTLDYTLRLQVNDNGETIKVPVIYGNPERWYAMKKFGNIRDNQGKILLPAVMIRRKSVENNKDLATFNRYLNYQVIEKYSEKNKYDRFDLVNKSIFKSKPTQQIYSVSLPNQVNISYECIIWTDYVDQNNKLLEQINYAAKDYWGDPERFKFRARVDSYSIEQEVNDGEDRNVKTTFDINVNAYLLNENYIVGLDGVKNTTQKLFTVRKVQLQENAVGSSAEMHVVNNSVDTYQVTDRTHIKDKPSDYVDVTGQGTMELKSDNVKDLSGYNKIPNSATTTTKTAFHPAPKSITDYGENGWVAYDSKYIYVYKYPAGWLKREIATFDYDYSSQTYISGYDCNGNPIYTTANKRPINTAFRIFQRFPDKFYHQVPYQSTDYGQDGWISYDGSYFYIYSANLWRRVPISLFN